MTAELKPCPFCGGEAEIERTTRCMITAEIRIFCTKCGATVRNWEKTFWHVGYFDTEEEAIEAWNRRAEDGTID